MGQETWSIREVQDQVRNLLGQAQAWYGRNIEPFEKLPEALDAAARILEQDLPAGIAELDRLTAQMAGLRASMPDVQADVTAAQARVRAAREEAEAAEQASHERIRQAHGLADARETELTRVFEFKGATLEREAAVRRETLAQDLARLEQQKQDLEAAITALKAKFA